MLSGAQLSAITSLTVVAIFATSGLVACGPDVSASAAAKPEHAEVFGTALDARSGEPVVGVLIQGPRATRAVTDIYGRFHLLGLRVGDSGLLTASRGEEYYGELQLRALRPGGFEVVFHLRSPE